jgi:hypothetical protein
VLKDPTLISASSVSSMKVNVEKSVLTKAEFPYKILKNFAMYVPENKEKIKLLFFNKKLATKTFSCLTQSFHNIK